MQSRGHIRGFELTISCDGDALREVEAVGIERGDLAVPELGSELWRLVGLVVRVRRRRRELSACDCTHRPDLCQCSTLST